jgi:Lytic polysaccharide monooxygenase AA14
MVVFSVQPECVWHRDTVFEIPADMPPCPNGKCMCSWWWIHPSDGGSDQNVRAHQSRSSLLFLMPVSIVSDGVPVQHHLRQGSADFQDSCRETRSTHQLPKRLDQVRQRPQDAHGMSFTLHSFSYIQKRTHAVLEATGNTRFPSVCPLAYLPT